MSKIGRVGSVVGEGGQVMKEENTNGYYFYREETTMW